MPSERLAAVAGTFTVLIGLVHLGMAPRIYDRAGFDALWFVGSGLAVILIGTLTILASSSRAWRALVTAAVGANVAGVGLAIAFGVLTHWREPQGPILTGVFALGLVVCVPHLRRR